MSRELIVGRKLTYAEKKILIEEWNAVKSGPSDVKILPSEEPKDEQ